MGAAALQRGAATRTLPRTVSDIPVNRAERRSLAVALRDLGLAACISMVARGLAGQVHSGEPARWPGGPIGRLTGRQRLPSPSYTQPHQTS